MGIKSVCLLGGTGFVGRHLCSRLADRRIRLRVLTRNAHLHRDLLVIPNLELMEADARDPRLLQAQLVGMDCAINLIGILNESRHARFQQVHAELPRQVVEACRKTGVGRLLHMSALGAAADAPSRYQRSKAEGEQAVLAAQSDALAVTCFRPSVIFGPGDSFFSRFADLLARAPLFFPLPTPDARFRPVCVSDVAEAFVSTLENRDSFGRSYELCGPTTYTLRELVEYTARLSGRQRTIIGLPDAVARLQGKLMGLLPGAPYSEDNYLSATVDNVCQHDGLAELGIQPVGIEAVAPQYLSSMALRHRYNVFRRSARRLPPPMPAGLGDATSEQGARERR